MEMVLPDDQGAELPPKRPARDHRGGFSFNIFFGRRPPVDDATYEPHRERAMKDAESSSGEIGSAADTHAININFSGGESRAQDGDRIPGAEDGQPTQEEMSEAEMWDRLAHIGTGAYPDTARVHRALRIVVTVLGLAIPAGLCVLGIATGQSGETIFYMTVFGLIVGVMLISTFP